MITRFVGVLWQVLRIVIAVALSALLAPFWLVAAACWISYWLTADEEKSGNESRGLDFKGEIAMSYGI